MKPDWKDAPEWAQWLAQDASGEWYWFELEPWRWEHEPGQWIPNRDGGGGNYALAGESMPPLPKESRPIGD